MVAILSLASEEAEEIAEASGAAVANHNAPRQTVLSGSDATIAAASRLAREKGGRAVLLGVTGPFHTAAMEPAAAPLGHALVYTTIRSPRVPVISNVTARPYRAPGEIRRLLVQQLTHPVLFRQSMRWAFESGVDTFHDFGPGTVVEGLATQTFEEEREVISV
jgi:[acyl-carrier-protein] S-malonyltransferase